MVSDAAGQPGWRMLHPASVAVNLIPRTWQFIKGAWPLLVLVLVGGGLSAESAFDLSILGVFLLMTVGQTVVHFATLRYRLADGRLEIRTGLLNRQVRVIGDGKVQNVELVRNVFHRLSGLVEVRIETASGQEVEGLLSALDVGEGQRLVEALSGGRKAQRSEEEVAEAPVQVLQWPDLVRYGATSTRLGAALVGLGVLFEVTTSVDPVRASQVGSSIGMTGMGLLLAAAVSGTWVLGILTATARHWRHTLRREADAMVSEEGLFTRRRVQLRLHKVQRLVVDAPWLRRWMGFGSLRIETAAAGSGQPGVERSVAFVPVVHADHIDGLVARLMPDNDLSLRADDLRRPHPRALTRGLIRGFLQGAALSALVAWWMWPFGLLGASAIIPGMLGVAWLDWTHQRWAVTDRVVLSRRGYLRRVTTLVARSKLQSAEVEQGPLLRRYGLGEVVVRVAGAGVVMPLLGHDEAYRLAMTLSATAGAGGSADRRMETAPTERVDLTGLRDELMLGERMESGRVHGAGEALVPLHAVVPSSSDVTVVLRDGRPVGSDTDTAAIDDEPSVQIGSPLVPGGDDVTMQLPRAGHPDDELSLQLESPLVPGADDVTMRLPPHHEPMLALDDAEGVADPEEDPSLALPRVVPRAPVAMTIIPQDDDDLALDEGDDELELDDEDDLALDDDTDVAEADTDVVTAPWSRDPDLG